MSEVSKLAENEVEAHEEGQHVPLAQAPLRDVPNRCRPPDLATLNREHAHLAGHTGQHEHGRVRRAEREVQMSHGPRQALAFIDRADREVHREQRSEEHELAGQPDDGAHAHQVRSAGRGTRYRSSVTDAVATKVIITTPRRGSAADPRFSPRPRRTSGVRIGRTDRPWPSTPGGTGGRPPG